MDDCRLFSDMISIISWQLSRLAAVPLAILPSMVAMSRGVVVLSRSKTAARSLVTFW